MTTTIQVEDNTIRQLKQLKLDLDHSTMDQTIQYLLYELNKGDENECTGTN